MKIKYWVSLSLACVGLVPMAAAPLFGPIIKNSPQEAAIFGTLIIGLVNAGWFFGITRRPI
jgi:hypothetical protein